MLVTSKRQSGDQLLCPNPNNEQTNGIVEPACQVITSKPGTNTALERKGRVCVTLCPKLTQPQARSIIAFLLVYPYPLMPDNGYDIQIEPTKR